MEQLLINAGGDSQRSEYRPLADRMRPRVLDEFVGQTHLLAAGRPLRQALQTGRAHSMVLWGPPGTGKTTLARIFAAQQETRFLSLSAVLSGVKEIRTAIDAARQQRSLSGRETILFIDEVHRFNKSQQDAFLPHIEDGTVTLIGATTENPAFELNNALLSRLRVYVLKALTVEDVVCVLEQALADKERGLGAPGLNVAADALALLARLADGDARRALNLLEIASDLAENGCVDAKLVAEIGRDGSPRRFDKGGDAFYEQISALHKSVRGSHPDASLYWLLRMLDGGCDPLYIARRLVRIASEDIGNADPRALHLALDAWDTQQRLGSPEGELALAQAVIFLACAPKSNAVYRAFNRARDDVVKHGSLEVPLHLRNAPTQLARELQFGREYRYAHDEPGAYAAGQHYFPESMPTRHYYVPTDRGLEKSIAEKLSRLRQLDADVTKGK